MYVANMSEEGKQLLPIHVDVNSLDRRYRLQNEDKDLSLTNVFTCRVF